MKKAIVLIVCSIITVMLAAQQSPVDKLFDKYAGQDGYTTVYITKYMFSMFAQMNDEDSEDSEELGKVLGKLDNIKILAVDDESYIEGQVNFYDEIMKELPMNEYNELMVVKEKDSDVIFLAREKDGVIVELLLIASGSSNSDNVLISIQGVIDLENIAKISHGLGIEGMESLEELEQLP
jgi:hypothetical protein